MENPLNPDLTPSLGSGDSSSAGPRSRSSLGPYKIEGEIGRGGMGVVYKAYHPDLKRTVALKALIAGEDASEEGIARFQREAEAVAKVGHHPNIVPIYDIGHEDRVHYFAMHFVNGLPLSRLIEDEALPPRRAAKIALQTALALQHMHEHGVLHRDVKPANILVTTEGEPQITDFGLAKDIESGSRMTRSGMTLGTPQYMPPEQAEGRLEDIDARSDVYALGATLYEMLTGEPPFTGTNIVSIVYDILLTDPVPPRKRVREIDRDLEVICLKCLEKNPTERYANARALAEDLERYLNNDSILAKPPSEFTKMRRFFKRNKVSFLTTTAATLLAIAFVVSLFFVLRKDPPPPAPPPTKAQAPQRPGLAKLKQGLGYLGQARQLVLIDDPANCRNLLDKALTALSESCAQDPNDAEAFTAKGQVLALLKRPGEALAAFDRAIEIDPEQSTPYYGRIRIHYVNMLLKALMIGQEASEQTRSLIEADLAKVEKIGLEPWVVHWGRSLLLSIEGYREDALVEVNRSLTKNRTFADGYWTRGGIRQTLALADSRMDKKSGLEEALGDFDKALRLAGEDTDYRISRIQVLMYLKRNEEAHQEANAMVAALHDTPYSYLLRAQIRLALGNREGFREDMEKADKMPFTEPDLHLVAASIILGGIQAWRFNALKTEDIEKALHHINLLVKKHPKRTEVLGLLGLLQMLVGRNEAAMASFDAYIEKHSDSTLAPTFRGAQMMLHAGVNLTYDSAAIAYLAATQLMGAGAWADAESHFRQVLVRIEKAPKSPTEMAKVLRRQWARICRIHIARLLSKRAGLKETDDKTKKILIDEALDLVDQAVNLGHAKLKAISTHQDYEALRNHTDYPARSRAWKKITQVEALVLALKDEEWEVRLAAVQRLGRLKDNRALFPLIGVLRDRSFDFRMSAAISLGEIGDKRALDALLEGLKDPSDDVRRGCSMGLGMIRDERIIEPLINVLGDSCADVRTHAVNGLKAQTGKDFGMDHKAWRRWFEIEQKAKQEKR